jgi:hypothetical protein
MKNLIITKRGIFLAALTLIASVAIAAEVYTYQCPRCGCILTFAFPTPGAKCPSDGALMVRR